MPKGRRQRPTLNKPSLRKEKQGNYGGEEGDRAGRASCSVQKKGKVAAGKKRCGPVACSRRLSGGRNPFPLTWGCSKGEVP